MNSITPAPPSTTQLAQPSLGLAPAAQSVQPEPFQSRLIAGMTSALLRQPSPPCLLRAPTGSGKTFVIKAFLKEAGLSGVALKNFRSKWVGSTEANLLPPLVCAPT